MAEYVRINSLTRSFRAFLVRSQPTMSFKGKVVLVTGASSGIGAATAIAFAAEGAQVAMVGRNQTKLKNVAEKCEQKGSKPLVIIGDVSKREDNKRIVSDTVKHFGRLDVLVNNAGFALLAGILAPNAMEVYEQVMATNLFSTVHLTHLAAPHLVQSKGNIVNVSSIAALTVPAVNNSAYMTSKAGMDHFTRAVALELAPKGVRVNVVNPGAVRTDIIENIGVPREQKDVVWEKLGQLSPLKKVGEPDEIADLILFLASDKARSITGSSYVSDNGGQLIGFMDAPWE